MVRIAPVASRKSGISAFQEFLASLLVLSDVRDNKVQPGEHFEFRGASNKTTGYSWHPRDFEKRADGDWIYTGDQSSPVLTVHSDTYVVPEPAADSSPMLGVGGEQILEMSIDQPGDHDIVMQYDRASATGEASMSDSGFSRLFKVQVEVPEAASNAEETIDVSTMEDFVEVETFEETIESCCESEMIAATA